MTDSKKPPAQPLSSDYEVGYGKPPEHTRFQPGRSGNPRGRPKGTKNLKTDLVEELGAWLGAEDAARLRLYPQRDVLPYERATDDPWNARSRLETLAALAGGGRAIVVASAEAVASILTQKMTR